MHIAVLPWMSNPLCHIWNVVLLVMQNNATTVGEKRVLVRVEKVTLPLLYTFYNKAFSDVEYQC